MLCIICVATDCSCNYVLNSCDLNCCCDSDCTADEIKVFAQCLDIQDGSVHVMEEGQTE